MARKIFGYGDFFCWNCGKHIVKNKSNCPHCKVSYNGKNKYGNTEALGAAGIGWSNNIRHPSLKNYLRNYYKLTLIWLIGLSLIVPGILIAIGDLQLDSEGIIVLKIIIPMFWIVAFIFLYFNFGRNERDWEGEIVDKTIFNDDEYIFTIKKTNGTIYEYKKKNAERLFDYFQIGDRVHYHGKKHLQYLEKYDKTKDTIIICSSCSSVQDTRDNFCGRCGSILLKGEQPASLSPTMHILD